MTIKRISELTENEVKACKTSRSILQEHIITPDEDSIKNYILEIISSWLAMNEGAKKVYSTIALYTTQGEMIHHEVYIDTITPEQMKEAEIFFSNNLHIYTKKKQSTVN